MLLNEACHDGEGRAVELAEEGHAHSLIERPWETKLAHDVTSELKCSTEGPQTVVRLTVGAITERRARLLLDLEEKIHYILNRWSGWQGVSSDTHRSPDTDIEEEARKKKAEAEAARETRGGRGA